MMLISMNADVSEMQKIAKSDFKNTWFNRLSLTEIFEDVVLEIWIEIRYWFLAVLTLVIFFDRKMIQRCEDYYAVSVSL